MDVRDWLEKTKATEIMIRDVVDARGRVESIQLGRMLEEIKLEPNNRVNSYKP